MNKNKLKKNKVLIIAEAGVNHNGSEINAKKLILSAKNAGADIIKFQLFSAKRLVLKNADKPEYIKKNFNLKKKTQYQILNKLELSYDIFKNINKFCKKNKIEFLLSPFDVESVKIIKKLKLNRIKIPSGEITNYPMLVEIAKLNLKVILSTGMATLKEIDDALKLLKKFGTSKKNITVLHCNTDYPTKFSDVNLLSMKTIKQKLRVKVGYSDHTQGDTVPIVAVTMGAEIIEKHFTLNKNMSGPDHKASLNNKEFKSMVNKIRSIDLILGNGKKVPSKSELKNIKFVRKSIVAQSYIRKGDLFSRKNITTKRPAAGISPMKWKKIIGKKASRDYLIDDYLKE